MNFDAVHAKPEFPNEAEIPSMPQSLAAVDGAKADPSTIRAASGSAANDVDHMDFPKSEPITQPGWDDKSIALEYSKIRVLCKKQCREVALK